MLLGILLGLCIANFFGAPLTPILLLGAFLQCGIAFFLTRNRVCINFIVALAILSLGPLQIKFITSQTHDFDGSTLLMVAEFLANHIVLDVMSILTIAVATIIGALGFGLGFSRSTKSNG